MSGSFVQRAIDMTITLGEGAFGDTGKNTVKLTGLRAVVTVQKAGMPSMDKAVARVYGVPPSIMNAVSTLGVPLTMVRHNNTVLIEAGDAMNGMAVVYSGYISQAWQSFDEAPEVSLNIAAWGGLGEATFPVAPISYPGGADVATMMQAIAGRMGWQFENAGVQIQLSAPYFAGSALAQAHAIARAANIEMAADTSTSPITLAIWPKTGTRGGQIPLISAASGLVGYPKFQSNGMSFRCLFNHSIRLGGQITMQSTVGAAAQNAPAGAGLPPGTQTGGPNGTWAVISPLSHDLAAQVPGGPWFTDVTCARVYVPGASS